MKVKSIILNDIKSFAKATNFDFSQSDKINTVSGINGSGKTTVFKSLILAQKLFFSKVFNLSLNNSEELLNYFNNTNSTITLVFVFEDGEERTFSLKCINRTKEYAEINLIITDSDKEKIIENWNIESPKNLIIYIDSNRNIFEENFSNEDINISSNDSKSLLLDYITQPDKLFNTTYERLIKDYIRERIIPSTPRTDLPHYTTKILLHNILDYLEFSNFTALERKDQFIMQVKTGDKKKKNIYDLRNLSSGEKTLFYVLHFICYVKSIGMLIIDEPENNLHEDMLTKFINMLSEVTLEENFSEMIFRCANNIKHTISPNLKKQIINYYKDHKLSQTYLLTHSKNLIYNNFTIGKNFVINKCIALIDYENHEKILREIGLSKIINKVLFVEGKTENEILQTILSSQNIKIKTLKNSYDVVETYKKYYSIHSLIRDVQFCFLIDRDTRDDSNINDIRNLDPGFFDNHFIILQRHEIENYLLDSTVIHNIYKRHNELNDEILIPTIEVIDEIIKDVADKNQEIVLRKTLQNLNQNSLSEIKLAISTKTLIVDNKTEYESYVKEVFNSDTIEITKQKIIDNFDVLNRIINDWEENWLSLCDGKIVLHQVKSKFARDLQITSERFIKELIKQVQNKKSHEFNNVINSIIKILN